MPTIALIDDRKSDRQSLATNFKLALPKNWKCLPIAPLSKPTDYAAWIARENIQVVVLDWLLNERKTDVEHPVSYMGQTVVAAVRKHYPNMPVFVITAMPIEELAEYISDIEAVFSRVDFSKAPGELVKPMIRAGERFAKQFEADLAELSKLSAKAAVGQISKKEMRQLRAIQASLGLASDGDADATRAHALSAFETKLDALESVGKDLQRFLKRKTGK